MRLAFWIAAVPALLGTTVVSAEGLSIGASIGAAVLKLPTGQNGVLTSGDVTVTGGSDPLLIGPTVSVSGALATGKVGDMDSFLGINLFATYGAADSLLTQNFSGVGTVYIPGLSVPDVGTINLTTTRGLNSATAGISVTTTSPQLTPYTATGGATSGPTTGEQSGTGVQPTPGDPSFVMVGANTQVVVGEVGKALAYAGIADTSGSLLIITGDLDGLSISTQTSTRVLYAGGDITWGVTKLQEDGVAVQAYGGPSYRYIGQWSSTTIGTDLVVNIPEVPSSTTNHPIWEQDTTTLTALNSHYFGGVIGGGVSKQVSDTVSIAVGAEASVYYASASLAGRGTVTEHSGYDGLTDTTFTPVTVPQDYTNTQTGTIAYAVRAQTSASFAIADSAVFTIAGSVDYLSQVARPYGGAVVTGTGGNASWTSANNSGVSFGDMFAFTGTASLTGHF